MGEELLARTRLSSPKVAKRQNFADLEEHNQGNSTQTFWRGYVLAKSLQSLTKICILSRFANCSRGFFPPILLARICPREQAFVSSLQETVKKQAEELITKGTRVDLMMEFLRSQPGWVERLASEIPSSSRRNDGDDDGECNEEGNGE